MFFYVSTNLLLLFPLFFFVVVVFCSFFFCAVKNILNVFRQVLVLISLAENAVHVSEKV